VLGPQVDGPPADGGSEAQTSGTAPGAQKTYSFWFGSHVSWHWIDVYVFVLLSSVPQQS
jgi:hypothetical protein